MPAFAAAIALSEFAAATTRAYLVVHATCRRRKRLHIVESVVFSWFLKRLRLDVALLVCVRSPDPTVLALLLVAVAFVLLGRPHIVRIRIVTRW